MSNKFDPILGKYRQSDTGTTNISEVASDPGSPVDGSAWVLRTASVVDGTAGEPRGLLLALTYAGATGTDTYQLSYKAAAGIKRISLS
jgi:hypothetical protein